jgi:hypothetical protein
VIAVRGLTSQLKITVDHGNRLTGVVEKPQHNNRVNSPAYRQQNAIGRAAQAVFTNVVQKLL